MFKLKASIAKPLSIAIILAILSVMLTTACSERPNGEKDPKSASDNKTNNVTPTENNSTANVTPTIPLGEQYCIDIIGNDSANSSGNTASPIVSNSMFLPAPPVVAGAGAGVGGTGAGVGGTGAGVGGTGGGVVSANNNTTNTTAQQPVQNPQVVVTPNANATNTTNATNSTVVAPTVIPLTLAQKINQIDVKYKSDWVDIVNKTKNINCKALTASSNNEEIADAIAKQITLIINFVRYYPDKYVDYINAYKDEFDVANAKAHFAQIETVSTDESFASISNKSQAYIDLDAFIKNVHSSSMTHPHLSYSDALSVISRKHSQAMTDKKQVSTVTLDQAIEGIYPGASAQKRIDQYLHTLPYVSSLINSFVAENVGSASVVTLSNVVGHDINVRLVALDIVFHYMLDPQQVQPVTEYRIHAKNLVSSNSCTIGVGVNLSTPVDSGTGKAFNTAIASTIDFMSACE